MWEIPNLSTHRPAPRSANPVYRYSPPILSARAFPYSNYRKLVYDAKCIPTGPSRGPARPAPRLVTAAQLMPLHLSVSAAQAATQRVYINEWAAAHPASWAREAVLLHGVGVFPLLVTSLPCAPCVKPPWVYPWGLRPPGERYRGAEAELVDRSMSR